MGGGSNKAGKSLLAAHILNTNLILLTSVIAFKGLIDTPRGVFFQSNKDANAAQASGQRAIRHSEPLVRLVEPGDKMYATDYAYFVMEQMATCVFTEADRLGKRKCHEVGFPGLACRHCYGGNGSGRFFPLTLKTFSDVSKSIHVLRNHLVKCTKAPKGMAKTVNMLYKRHKDEKVRYLYKNMNEHHATTFRFDKSIRLVHELLSMVSILIHELLSIPYQSKTHLLDHKRSFLIAFGNVCTQNSVTWKMRQQPPLAKSLLLPSLLQKKKWRVN